MTGKNNKTYVLQESVQEHEIQDVVTGWLLRQLVELCEGTDHMLG